MGARFQSGDFHTSDLLNNPVGFYTLLFSDPAAAQNFETSLERESFYVYDIWRPFRSLSITGGFSYDRLSYPADYRDPPILDGESSRSRVSPKAGFIWNPIGNLFLRGAYTQSLGGVSFDESVQLEPNQVAGFNQVFRSIISESRSAQSPLPPTKTRASSLKTNSRTGTYVAAQATLLRSDVDRRRRYLRRIY